MQKLLARVTKLKAINIAQLSDTPLQKEDKIKKTSAALKNAY